MAKFSLRSGTRTVNNRCSLFSGDQFGLPLSQQQTQIAIGPQLLCRPFCLVWDLSAGLRSHLLVIWVRLINLGGIPKFLVTLHPVIESFFGKGTVSDRFLFTTISDLFCEQPNIGRSDIGGHVCDWMENWNRHVAGWISSHNLGNGNCSQEKRVT